MTTQPSVRYCHGGEGHYCHPPKECCKQGCCYPPEDTVYRTGTVPSTNMFAPVFVGHWYFWAAITATLAGILCACSLWRRHNNSWAGSSLFFCCGNDGGGGRDDHCSEPDSNGSCYAPPQYCSSFLQAPPPYSEVASKPELYPLVISYHGDPGVKTMVQYFRNFIVRPVGTLSATSTIDSLSSSFICNTANEANNIIPPPYSCMGSLEEVTINTLGEPPPEPPPPPEESSSSSPSPPTTNTVEDETVVTQQPSSVVPPSLCDTSILQCSRPPKPSSIKPIAAAAAPQQIKLRSKNASLESESDEHNFSDLLNLSLCAPGVATQSNPQVDMIHSFNSVANSMTSSDISSLANLGTPDSPPRATSPTLEMKELLDKIQQLPQQHKSPVGETSASIVQPRTIKHYFSNRSKAKTLYMPLGGEHQETKKTKGWLSRSAPTTPCGTALLPTFPTPHNATRSAATRSRSRVFDGKPLLEDGQCAAPQDECL